MKIPNKVKLIDKRKLTHIEWTSARNAYMGGSDIASCMGLNPFESALEAFHRKIGAAPSSKPMQLSSYSGVVMEDVIYKSYWRYYLPENPTDDITVENAVANKVIRTAKKKNFTMQSLEFPWLASNVDYVIDKNNYTPPGILDCKNSLQYVVNQYESGVAAGYVLQLQQYMLVSGFDYSELAYLLDGRYPKIIPITGERTLQEHIIRESKLFWDKVIEGRKIWDDTSMTEEERFQELSSLEPDLDSSVALEDYLKERFKKSKKNGQMVLTQDIIDCGKEYLLQNENLNKVEDDKRLQGNLLRQFFLTNGVDELVDAKGRVIISYRAPEGKSPVLRVGKELLKM